MIGWYFSASKVVSDLVRVYALSAKKKVAQAYLSFNDLFFKCIRSDRQETNEDDEIDEKEDHNHTKQMSVTNYLMRENNFWLRRS